MKKLIKKDFLIPLFILLFFIHANFISAFGFEFQIQTTSPNENFNWGIYDASNITVNWGDSASNETLNGSYVFANHSYSVADTYNISLIGNATRISFYNGTEDSLINILTPISNGLDGITSGYEMFRDAKNITNFTTENFFDETSSNVTNMWSMFRDATNFNGNISNWNTSSVVEMGNMFYGATSFNGNISNWDVSNVNNMYSMFRGLTFFNQDLNNWDVSSVTEMRHMFRDATSFNGNISNWNTSKVINMDNMFNGAVSFNQNLTTWDTSNLEGVDAMFYNVTNFNGNISNWNISKISDTWYMFAYAISFNQNLTNWDTSKVINMDHMFYNATSFNGNISNWNTSSVTDMNNMFYNATSFNQDLSNWDVSSVTNMDNMFYNATNFNGNISSWNISKVESMENMFYGATLDTEIYDEILINWANLSSLKNNTPFHAGNSKYSSSASDKRNYIITNYNWTITDGGLYFSGEETPVPSSSGGGGGSGGGGSTIPTIIFSKEQFEKGYSANLAVGSRFEVNVENKEHHVMLNEMTSLTASITISSEPQNATLVVGESKKFEVNEDNYYDLLVTLNSIDLEKNLVNLTLKYIHEEIFNKEILNNQSSVEEGNISGEERLYEEGKKIRISFGFYFIFAVILIIGIVLLIKFKKFKKWKKQK